MTTNPQDGEIPDCLFCEMAWFHAAENNTQDVKQYFGELLKQHIEETGHRDSMIKEAGRE